MPLNKGYTTRNGKRVGFWRFGNLKKYFYKIGNKRSEALAKARATKMGRAIKRSQNLRGK